MKTMEEMSVESLIAKSWDGRYRDQMSETEDEILVRLIETGLFSFLVITDCP